MVSTLPTYGTSLKVQEKIFLFFFFFFLSFFFIFIFSFTNTNKQTSPLSNPAASLSLHAHDQVKVIAKGLSKPIQSPGLLRTQGVPPQGEGEELDHQASQGNVGIASRTATKAGHRGLNPFQMCPLASNESEDKGAVSTPPVASVSLKREQSRISPCERDLRKGGERWESH